MMYFQVEGRQKLFWRFGGVLWTGVGQVFDNFQNFDIAKSRIVYGIGGRYQAIKGQSTNARVDVGFSDDGGTSIYVSIQEAF